MIPNHYVALAECKMKVGGIPILCSEDVADRDLLAWCGIEPLAVATQAEPIRRELRRACERIAELTRDQRDKDKVIAELSRMASTDELTDLCNRRHFVKEIESAFSFSVRHGLPLSIAMIDVDHFKLYNDSFGHVAGDHVLQLIAALLLQTARPEDVVVRYGGEEFMVLLPATDAGGARAFARRVQDALESYDWTLRPVTASLGVATIGPATADAESLVEEADRAMYHSKRNGRNRVTHHHDLVAAGSDSIPALSSVPVACRGASLPDDDRTVDDVSTSMRDGAAMIEGLPPSMPGRSHVEPAPSRDSAWEVLDGLIEDLEGDKKVQEHVSLALGAICDGTGADTAFLFSEASGEVTEVVSGLEISPRWCRDIAQRLLIEFPQGGIAHRSDLTWRSSRSCGPVPETIAMASVDGRRKSWVFTLSYDRANPLQASDLKVITIIWRLQVDHARHASADDNLKETLFGVIRCLSTAIDAKDPYTCGHSERVARIAVRIGQEMGRSPREVSDLYLAGLLHDVGKIGIRDEVLLKPGPLTPAEYAHIKEHPVTGDRIVSNVKRLSYLCPGVRSHHERYDGLGYPDGLAGEAIPLMARILAVADSCDAMMSTRRYRPLLSPATIEAMFRADGGAQWDPEIVGHFLACRHELYAVCQRGLGQSVYLAVERAAGPDAEAGRHRIASEPDLTSPKRRKNDQPTSIGSALR